MAIKQPINMILVGDLHPDRANPDEAFDMARPVLKAADVVFGQFEGVCTDNPALAAHIRSTLTRMPTSTGPAFKKAGFTVASCAGNHSMSYAGFLDTLDVLKEVGVASVGMGHDIEEARKPAIMEAKGTRVGFLAVNCVGNLPAFHAGVGRPGTVPLKIRTSFEMTDLQPGIGPTPHTEAHEGDMRDLLDSIAKVRPQVDVLVLSFHWGLHLMPYMHADYEHDVAHAVIDAGADLVVGTHPHLLKGIEVYKGKPIFYSLGNFVFDQYSLVSRDLIEKYGPHNVPKELVKKPAHQHHTLPSPRKWDPECPLYQWPPVSRRSMMVKCAIDGGKVRRISVAPVWINGKAQPEIVAAGSPRGREIIDFLNESSEQFDFRLKVEGDEAVVV